MGSHKVSQPQRIPLQSSLILLKTQLRYLMLTFRGSITIPTQQPASFLRNEKNQDLLLASALLSMHVLSLILNFIHQRQFLHLWALTWEDSAVPSLCTIPCNQAFFLHLLLWSPSSDMVTGRGPSRDQILDQGEGQDEDLVEEAQDPGEGVLGEEMAIKGEDEEMAIKEEDEVRAIKGGDEDEDEERAQFPQGIVPTSSTTSPWSKIHGGNCCELM